MSVPVNFWHDFNAALFDTFNKPESNCLAPVGLEKQMWRDRIDIAEKNGGDFLPYPMGLSLREVMVVLDDMAVTTFVMQELKGMIQSFLGPGSNVEAIHKDFTVDLLKEGGLSDRYMLHVPFNALSVLVSGSQAHPEYLNINLYAVQPPIGSCTLVDGVLGYEDKIVTVQSAFSRLQISNVEAGTKRLEVDLSTRLAVVFDGGEILRKPSEDLGLLEDEFEAYVQTTRKTQEAVAALCREKIVFPVVIEESFLSEEEVEADIDSDDFVPLIHTDGTITRKFVKKRSTPSKYSVPLMGARIHEVGVVIGPRLERKGKPQNELGIGSQESGHRPVEQGVVIGDRRAKRRRSEARVQAIKQQILNRIYKEVTMTIIVTPWQDLNAVSFYATKKEVEVGGPIPSLRLKSMKISINTCLLIQDWH